MLLCTPCRPPISTSHSEVAEPLGVRRIAGNSPWLMDMGLQRLLGLLNSSRRDTICYSFRSWNLVFGCVCAIGVAMTELIKPYMGFLAAVLKSRPRLQAENLALRHQLCVYQRSVKRPKAKPADRIPWSLLARVWAGWRDALVFVKPDTIIRWQRKRFKAHWRKLSQSGEPGRPPVADEVIELIRTMSSMNPMWGSPRIVGELAKLGITVTKSTVDKYRVRVPKPPSPTWRAFLKNHMTELVSVDFLVVPTVRFRILYVFLILSLDRRRIPHFAVINTRPQRGQRSKWYKLSRGTLRRSTCSATATRSMATGFGSASRTWV